MTFYNINVDEVEKWLSAFMICSIHCDRCVRFMVRFNPELMQKGYNPNVSEQDHL